LLLAYETQFGFSPIEGSESFLADTGCPRHAGIVAIGEIDDLAYRLQHLLDGGSRCKNHYPIDLNKPHTPSWLDTSARSMFRWKHIILMIGRLTEIGQRHVIKWEEKFYKILDAITRVRVDPQSITKDLEEAAAYRVTPAIQEMNTEFIALDTKASALVSHLSLMIAAISILHATTPSMWLKRIFIFEIVYYLFTLVLVIRVIYYSYYDEIIERTVKTTTNTREVGLMIELRKRMEYFRMAHMLTNLGTVILILSLFLAVLR
jgi:phage terminase small subunit